MSNQFCKVFDVEHDGVAGQVLVMRIGSATMFVTVIDDVQATAEKEDEDSFAAILRFAYIGQEAANDFFKKVVATGKNANAPHQPTM